MVATTSPTVLRRYVALEMARLRNHAGLRREEVAVSLRCSVAQIGHIETMHSLPKVLTVRALAALYGVPERSEEFVDLIDAARRGRDWFADYPGIPKDFELLLALETGAATIHTFDTTLIPGLLQTAAYTESVIRAGSPGLSDDQIKQRTQVRMVRQDILVRQPDPAKVWCILDESVLRRDHPDSRMWHEQLDELLRLSAKPNVRIQVLPYSASGLHPGMDGAFKILTFPPELAGDPGVVYTETRIRGTYYEDPADVAKYRDTWSEIQLLALDPDNSRDLLARRAQESDTL